MFYDNFSEDQICGLFTPWHFFAIAMFFLVVDVCIGFFSKNDAETDKNHTSCHSNRRHRHGNHQNRLENL